MTNFDKIFEQIGQKTGSAFKKGKWFYSSLLGSEEEAIKAEFSIGLEMAKSMAKENKVTFNPVVKEITYQIKSEINSNHKFNFYVIDSDDINAFALPGGFIFITRELLELVEYNKDEIAFVIGHEMGHVIKGHAMDRILAEYSITTLAGLLSTKGFLMGAVKNLSTKYLISSYSRENEHEADEMGVRIMFKAGYEKRASIQLLKRLKSLGNDQIPYFASHPAYDKRIAKIEELFKPKS